MDQPTISETTEKQIKESDREVATENQKKMREQKSLFKAWNFPHCCQGRSDLCKHKFGCYENIIRSALKSFLIGYLTKTLINSLSYILRPAKLVSFLLSAEAVKDCSQFSLFLALMIASYKAILCLLRRLLKDDKISSLIAGFCCGLAISVDIQKRRILIALIMLARALDCFVNVLQNHDILHRIKYFEFFIWSVSAAFLKYCKVFES